MRTLKAGGADIVLCASNPLSTQDDVAAALVAALRHPHLRHQGRGHRDLLRAHRRRHRPQAADDDGRRRRRGRPHPRRAPRGARATSSAAPRRPRPASSALRAMAADGALKYPIISVNDAKTKHLFDNRYGTGQSTLDGVIRATNRLLAGRTLVVSGYGWCGRGIAMRADGHGRQRHRARGRSAQGARGRHGRLPRHARRRGRQASATSGSPSPATSTSSTATRSTR